MCHVFKRILVRKSKQATAKHKAFRICVAECVHGIPMRFAVDAKNASRTYVLVGKTHWKPDNSANWPAEVLKFFEDQQKPKTPKIPKKSLIERRAEKAMKNRAKWQRRLTIAKNKFKQYDKQVKHYEKKLPQAIFEHLFKQVPEIDP